jgi:fumarate reductase subunit C
MSRRPYVREMKRSWWLGRPRYVRYMMRELTSLFIGLYCAGLTLGLVCLAKGSSAWDAFLAAAASPPAVLLQLLCLAAAVYHSITWFAVTPKAMPLTLRGEPLPSAAIIGTHYAAWAVVSLVVLFAARI